MKDQESLSQIIDQLQIKIEELTRYLQVEHARSSASLTPTPAFYQGFSFAKDVYLSPGFYTSPWDTKIHVMVEESSGYFRQIDPVVSFSGGYSLTVSFDVPRTGYIIVESTVMVPTPPGMLPPTEFFHRLSDGLAHDTEAPIALEASVDVPCIVTEEAEKTSPYERAMKVIE